MLDQTNSYAGEILGVRDVQSPATFVEGITFSTNSQYMFVVGEKREMYIYYNDTPLQVVIPEPASFSMLALGSLALVRRRKRTR